MAYTTINKSSDYFNTKLYTGTGSTRSVTGVGFKPDFVWIKNRVKADSNHFLLDIVRGATKYLHSDADSSETTNTNTLTSFDSDGFSLGDLDNVNKNNDTLVSWNWLAGGGQGSANTAGGINSTVSVNTTSGFSIVKYTGNGSLGSTVGHGLSAVPQVIITKRLTSTDDWIVQHHQITTGNPWDDLYCVLNTTAGRAGSYSVSGGYTPTSSLIYLGNDGRVNGNGQDYISYVFAGKTGYSKFGSYTGNGSSDGTFCYTGMKPSFVMVKKTSAANNFVMTDNKRDSFNDDATNYLLANDSGVAGTGLNFDLLSNGFKLKSNSGGTNTSGATYIYMAFAEAPLVGSNNVPCTAR